MAVPLQPVALYMVSATLIWVHWDSTRSLGSGTVVIRLGFLVAGKAEGAVKPRDQLDDLTQAWYA